jgi:membrane fusion protein (multidrug efflux system)
MKFLFEQGAVPEVQYDAAETEYEVNKASFDAVDRLVNLRSPIAGEVTSVDVTAGEFVQVGQNLATVATVDKLRLKFGVRAEDLELITPGSDVSLSAPGNEATLHGQIVSVARSADPATRRYSVEALMDNIAGKFHPGQFVRVSLTEAVFENVIVVPQGTVLNLDGINTAYVVQNGAASVRQVELGPSVNGSVIVRQGLESGDTLVTLGQDYLEEGVKLNVTELVEG